MKHQACKAILIAFFGLWTAAAFAQKPAHYYHENKDHRNALELFDKEKYSAAQREFEEVVKRIPDPNDEVRIDAEYHAAICAMELMHKDANYRLDLFVKAHPESHWVPAARFQMGRYAFRRKKWKDAIKRFNEVDKSILDERELSELYFKRGYSYFQEEKFEKAQLDFYEIKDGESEYSAPATYYYAHISYTQGKYQQALQHFEKLKDDPGFGPVVPYYIAQIMYLQGRYDDLIAYAPPLLEDTANVKRQYEMARILGEAYYNKEGYAEAVPYLEQYRERAHQRSREDNYILGYSYYRTQEYSKALDRLNDVTREEDSLAQVATYHMADCYMELSQKNYARNAFKSAYQMGFDEQITEDALFNYAKVSYELSFDPYHEAIKAFEHYLRDHPDSPRKDEAYEFLLNIYMSTKDYKAALDALDKIENKDLRLKTAYQKLAYNRGVEMLDNRKYTEAAYNFERVNRFPVNPDLNARSTFWMAEIYFRLEQFDDALRKYDEFRNEPGAYGTGLYPQADYSMGYCYFKKEDYVNAATSFRKYTGAAGGDTPKKLSDAHLRTGDCYFVQKDFPRAVEFYDKAIAIGAYDKAYAQYQKAICLGLGQDQNGKMQALEEFIARYPNSRLMADARYQLGETYIRKGLDAKAKEQYTAVVVDHPTSVHTRNSMLQLGLIEKRQGNDEAALAMFKKIVEQYPTVEGSKDALASMRSIYVETGNVAGYQEYVSGLTFIDPATIDLDEDYYRAAETKYFAEDCIGARNAFSEYLDKYPVGAYALNAHYYRGDCAYKSEDLEAALNDLSFVIEQSGNPFMEQALVGVSTINFNDGAFEAALSNYISLEKVAEFPTNVLAAQVGQMRCYDKLNDHTHAEEAANWVLANDKASDALITEGNLIKGRALLALDRREEAFTAFKIVDAASVSEMGAEAKYLMAYIQHADGDHKASEASVFELVQGYPSYMDWRARGLILLADNYVELGDNFQAKATLQSVIDNASDPALAAMAQQKLDDIVAGEEAAEQAPAQDTLEIEMGTPNNDGNE